MCAVGVECNWLSVLVVREAGLLVRSDGVVGQQVTRRLLALELLCCLRRHVTYNIT